MKVFKYMPHFVHAGKPASLAMPVGARVIHVDTQNDNWCFWAEVDTNEPTEERRFVVLPTGLMDIPEGAQHMKSKVFPGGFVWHIYELPKH